MSDALHHPQHHIVPDHDVDTFMDRAERVVRGATEPGVARVVTRAPRSLADANDEWVAQRAMAEQVASEANAVLTALGHATGHLELVDEVGAGRLAFVLKGPGGWVEVAMQSADGLAWLGCTGTVAGLDANTELADPRALEDVALRLLG
jgi:hypothetical protein